MAIRFLDQGEFLANYKNPEDLIGEEGLLKHLTKLVVERALDAELSEHLGHEKHGSVANESGNTVIPPNLDFQL